MEQIGSILKKFVREIGIDRNIMRHQVLIYWPSIVGKKMAEVTEPKRVQNGKIFVAVKNDSWRNELLFYKMDIVAKINNELGSVIIKDIVLL